MIHPVLLCSTTFLRSESEAAEHDSAVVPAASDSGRDRRRWPSPPHRIIARQQLWDDAI